LGQSIKYSLFLLIIFPLMTGGVAFGDDLTPEPITDKQAPDLVATATSSTPQALDVVFDVTPRQQKGKLYFDVRTNLPDGMIFMSAIRDEAGFVCKSGSTMERLETETADGALLLGPFPLGDKPFPSGEYTLYIHSYPGEYQPQRVAAVIGDDGANLAGRDVIHGLVVFAQEFMITGSESSSIPP
jgi:hypothetical protein